MFSFFLKVYFSHCNKYNVFCKLKSKPSAYGEGNEFSDWNQIQILTTTQKSVVSRIK